MVRYIKSAYNPNDVDAMEKRLYKYFKGDEGEFLTAVLQALSYDQKYEIYDYLMRNYDVDYALDGYVE